MVVVLVLLTGCAEERSDNDPVSETTRSITTGRVVGTSATHGGHQWLGIPYARPPVNDRRWRAPEAASNWEDTKPVLAHAPPCAQPASPLGGIPDVEEGTPVGRENCLKLDVYAPAFAPEEIPTGDERLPVMVWIHGGGNVVGRTAQYDPSQLATDQNVIVVAVQYRLGPLGWFRHPSLRGPRTTAEDASGNYALLDLIQSLKWVRTNIDHFGGNPDRVTVFGESAGGRNVFNLMFSPKAEGLFQRAIVQSGALHITDPEEAENFTDNGGDPQSSNEILVRLLIRDNRADDRGKARELLESMSPDATANYLRQQSAADLIAAYDPSPLGLPIDPPRVFGDGIVLPDTDPLSLLRDTENYNDVPLILGSNRDETRLFLSQDPDWVHRFLWLIPQVREPELYYPVAEYTSNLWKAHAVDEPASVLHSSQGPSVYGYRFDWDEFPTVLGTDLSKILGSPHAFEIPFVLGDFSFGGERASYFFTEQNRAGRVELSRKMRTYWAQFARTGNPNPPGSQLPRWSPWDPATDGTGRYLVFDTENNGPGTRMKSRTYDTEKLLEAVESDPRLKNQRERCVVYRAMAASVGNGSRPDYERRSACEEFPWRGYPWRN